MTASSTMPSSVNVAGRLTAMAQAMPDAIAVVEPLGYGPGRKRQYRRVTFRELDQDSDRIAQGLRGLGAGPGTRLALLVRPGIDFISLVFALLKAGVVVILIDPGMGRRSLIGCLAEAEPDGFVAIPVVHAVRTLVRRRFPKARFNVTVGRRWFWGGVTLDQLRAQPHHGAEPALTTADDPAAIIFTTGSTGPAKGVLFTHGNFDAQVSQIRDFYGIEPGGIDLPCFPMFGLFNCAMGVTAVIPDMDPSRPATVDPRNVIEAIDDWKVTQAFGSPAVWNRVGRYCREHGVELRSVRRVLSAGAPIPADVLERMKACIHPEGDVHTPYGATEALPVASIAASEVLGKPAARTGTGAGVCVGRKFSGIEWKVVRIVDGPIGGLDEAEELPCGEIGELIVRGPQVTRQYVNRPEANQRGKIRDGDAVWHRMGDVGYLDEQGRFWYCGRLAHRVLTADGPIYPVRCEAIFNRHPHVFRSAVVGVGPPGQQRGVAVLEPVRGRMPRGKAARDALIGEVRRIGESNRLTAGIQDFLLHPAFPVDIRHNAKIFREKLAVWAAEQLGRKR
ncbi:MAG TPA: fatty acid CoA ligase family protein [Thermoguttaceae bacterium]|nr:fatty acid CoA ligase family protein [Thermoguttaceae bacterium]